MMLTAKPPDSFFILRFHVVARFPHSLDDFIERDLVITVPRIARRAALIALIAPIALRSMHGTCTKPPTGSQSVLNYAPCQFPQHFRRLGQSPMYSARPAAAIEQATPTTLAADFGTRDRGVFLV